MTDHLEQYRRLARAIRFVPPLPKSQLTETKENHSSLTSSVSHFPVTKISSPAQEEENFGPPPDPSEHIAALVKKAVSQHTVLPVAYQIQENIGDRIGRLSNNRETQPQKPLIILPKIPAPDPNWTPSTPVTQPETVAAEVTANHIPETSTNGKLPVEQVESAEEKLQENLIPPELEIPPAEELIVKPLNKEDSAIETQSELVEVGTLATKITTVETPETEPSSEIIVESETVTAAPIQEPDIQQTGEDLKVQEAVTEQLKNVVDSLTEVSEKLSTPEPTTSKKPSARGWIITEIICPKCGSNKVKDKGQVKGQQKYACKNCGKRWRVDLEPNGEND
ncbi:hypothetical protein ACE1B6_20560 [Aerosakkonemataceae cyanobacterium BLCC-F154]|uniref:GATA-type domain-containing protein n=1 Tax=Floridaenema fluviatile BLCC-F154 TaxID=3153640 RepID=A0ABV4YHQ8_9CYAN